MIVKHGLKANREKTFMSRGFGWAYEQGIAKLNPWGGLKTFAAILLPLGVFQAQKNRLPAATTLLLIALIILELFSLVPGAGLEPAQP